MQLEPARLLFGACALLPLACAPREIPPPRPPAREIPAAEARTKPPADGQTRVLLDANGERAKVTEVATWSSSFVVAPEGSHLGTAFGYADLQRPICLSPCLADFSPGLHRLMFVSDDGKRSGGVDIQVGDQAKVLRIALGRSEPARNSAGPITLLVTGAAFLVVGGLLAASASTSASPDQSDAQERGLILFGTGAGAVLAGIPWLLMSRGVHQDSAVTEFDYQPDPPSPPEPAAGSQAAP